jgi:hypothetical protein
LLDPEVEGEVLGRDGGFASLNTVGILENGIIPRVEID